MRSICLVLCLTLAACAAPSPQPSPPPVVAAPAPPPISSRAAARNFAAVVARVEPIAESYCRQRSPELNCDFRIIVDDRPELGSNAYQTQDRSGRPIIAFTPALIADTRNQDELAFVMSHEAAHHIRGHLLRKQRNATVGALVLGQLAGSLINDASAVQTAQQLGANVAARTYSKEFELEADALGTQIAAAAGYDPMRGAQFFFRIPDPGDRFLGSHPANADRLRTVQRVAAGL